MADAALDVAPGHADAGSRWRRIGPRLGFVAMLVVLAVALAIGCGVGSSGTPTVAQRAAAIEADIKCPSCDDINVAQSEATTAIGVRRDIERWVAQGQSATEIDNRLVRTWGTAILLDPPASGWSLLVWLLPAVGGAAALGLVGRLFWRRSVAMRRLRAGAS